MDRQATDQEFGTSIVSAGQGARSQIKGSSGYPWNCQSPPWIEFACLLNHPGVASWQILRKRKMVPLSPAASPSGLEKPSGVRGKPSTSLETRPCVGSLLRTDTGGVQPSAATTPTTPRTRRWGLSERSFSSQKLYAETQSRSLPQRSEIVPEANYSIFCKGQRTLKLCGHTGMSTFSAAPEVSCRLKGIDWHGVPQEMHFQVSFCHRLHVLTNKSLGRKKVSVSITKRITIWQSKNGNFSIS